MHRSATKAQNLPSLSGKSFDKKVKFRPFSAGYLVLTVRRPIVVARQKKNEYNRKQTKFGGYPVNNSMKIKTKPKKI